MPQFESPRRTARFSRTESQGEPIGDLCPVRGSLVEPIGDVGAIVGDRVIETCGSTSHAGALGACRLMADGVSEIIARGELEPARVGFEIESRDARSVSRQLNALSARAHCRAGVRRRRRAPTAAAPPWLARALGAFDGGRQRREPGRQTMFALRLRRELMHRHTPVCATRVEPETRPDVSSGSAGA
jgi:hypothetical protein